MSSVNFLGINAGAGQPASARNANATAGEGFRAAFADAAERNRSAMGRGVSGAAQSAPSQAEQEFMDYAAMSIEDKMFYAALASLGISKEEYDAMSAAERLEVAQKVSQAMQQLAKAENTKEVL
ncbi:hypothetical protein LMG26684_00500 [Achromobacter mucicolens]|uniref:hypothetical protein n=1 Tax=Achromobacter mucicolens TaxID=1389922 RepID=UPI0014668374|nr:hypothetical protein [Achromobacter mucicolens]CAB3819363.1 hypothetical protein LMG26684_00500 [Achromobacter mucicolens]